MVDFWGFFVLIVGTYFLSRAIPKWKDIAKNHKGEDWRLDVKITFSCDENMIDFNNINCALKDNDAIDNIMNIFFRHILKGVPKDPWIALTQLMNTLWVIDVKQFRSLWSGWNGNWQKKNPITSSLLHMVKFTTNLTAVNWFHK
jgi:hypothetical protein